MDNIDKILIQIGIDTKPLDRNKQEALQKLRELATGAERIGKDSGKGFERGFKRSARDIQQAGMLMFSFLGSYLGNVFADKFSGTMKEGIAGAIAGAGIGSMFSPVIGTIIGAGVGGILGVVTKGLLEYREQLKSISLLSDKFNVPKDKVKELFDVAAGADKKETVTKVLERWSKLMDEIIKKNPQVIQALKNAGVITSDNADRLLKMTPEDIERQAVLNPLYEFQKTYRTGTPPQLDDNLMLIFLNKYLAMMKVSMANERLPELERRFAKKLPSTDLTQSEVESWIRTLIGENPALGGKVVETISQLFGGSNKAYTEALSKYLKQDFDIMAMSGEFQSGPDFINTMMKRSQGIDSIEYEKRKQAQKAKDAEELQRLQEKLNEYETESLAMEDQKARLLKEVRQLMWDIQDTEEGSIENMRMKVDIAEKEKKISEVTRQSDKAKLDIAKELANISSKRLDLVGMMADRNKLGISDLLQYGEEAGVSWSMKRKRSLTRVGLRNIRLAREISNRESWIEDAILNQRPDLVNKWRAEADFIRRGMGNILTVAESNPMAKLNSQLTDLNNTEKELLDREESRGLNMIPHMATRR